METEQPATESRRRWLVPAAAAAAVVVLAGGAYVLSTGGGEDPEGAPVSGPSSSATDDSGPSDGASSGGAGDAERYAMPPRPLLLDSAGWKPEVVEGEKVTWSGPDGARVQVRFFVYGGDENPFHRGSHPRGEKITALEVRTRVTPLADAADPSFLAITAPVLVQDGTGVELEGTFPGRKAAAARGEFVDVLRHARWVPLKQYAKVVKPAVG